MAAWHVPLCLLYNSFAVNTLIIINSGLHHYECIVGIVDDSNYCLFIMPLAQKFCGMLCTFALFDFKNLRFKDALANLGVHDAAK